MNKDLCHCTSLRKAARRLTARYDEALSAYGINVAQFSLLRHISRMQPVSLTELADRVELDRSTLGRNSRVLQRMELIGLGIGKDQREASLALTPRGREIIEEASPAWERVQGDIERRLGAERIALMHGLLEAI